jgi:sirohydrochlorin cobaltochelatase
VSGLAQEIALEKWLAANLRRIGQISIAGKKQGAFSLSHREDAARNDLTAYARAEDAADIARFDDAGEYRPLKTAPNLRHGWQLTVNDLAGLRLALDLFYPGRLSAFLAWESGLLATTQLRQTLERQTGMYRNTVKLRDEESDALVGNLCRSDRGCLRTILWKRDGDGTSASTQLPMEKFDPRHDQIGLDEAVIPLLCQEACNLLVAEARKIVQESREVPPGRP